MVLPIIGAIAGSLIAGGSAKSAAKTQAAASDRASKVQQNIFDQTSGFFEPYREAGQNALGTYTNQIGTDFKTSPGYQFRMGEGLKAIEGSAAARGNLMSGSTLNSLQKYGQDYASNEYRNWLGGVRDVVGLGQASAGQQAAAGQSFANNQSQLITGAGNALAAGQIGMGNAINGGINNALGIWQYQKAQQ